MIEGATSPASEPGGRVVPVYAMTGGRTRSAGRDLSLETLVSATGRPAGLRGCQPEYQAIVDVVDAPVSIVEVAAGLGIPLGVARVLVSDLADAGYLVVHAAPETTPDGRPSPELLERLLEGLLAR